MICIPYILFIIWMLWDYVSHDGGPSMMASILMFLGMILAGASGLAIKTTLQNSKLYKKRAPLSILLLTGAYLLAAEHLGGPARFNIFAGTTFISGYMFLVAAFGWSMIVGTKNSGRQIRIQSRRMYFDLIPLTKPSTTHQ